MKPKKPDMVEVDLLDFIKNSERLAKLALETDTGKPAEGGLARWKHLFIRGYRPEDDHSYRETENRFRCFSELREILELDLNDVPDFSTIYSVQSSGSTIRNSDRRSSDGTPDDLLSVAADK